MTSPPKRSRRAAAPNSRPSPAAANALRRAEELAESFKMLGNANRLKILVFLDGHGRSVGDMEAALSIHQPTLSQQLAELRNAGLIVGRKAAKSVIYTLTDDTGRPALEAIYLASGHAVTPAPPRSHSSTQAAVFASVLSTRGSPAPLWYPGMKSVIEE